MTWAPLYMTWAPLYMTWRRLFVIPSGAEESLRRRGALTDVLPERCFDFAQHDKAGGSGSAQHDKGTAQHDKGTAQHDKGTAQRDKGAAQHDMAPLNMTRRGAPASLSTTW